MKRNFFGLILIVTNVLFFLSGCGGESNEAVSALNSGGDDNYYASSQSEYSGAPISEASGSAVMAETEVLESTPENVDELIENPYIATTTQPTSTFSIDVDTAAYALIRSSIQNGSLPDKNRVRIEEMVNYFIYDYPQPTDEHPFSSTTEIAACPWNKNHELILFGLKGKEIPAEQIPPSNLVFLIDVSGSMADDNKLPMIKEALAMLVEELDVQDRVAIVTYASTSGVALDSTPGDQKESIMAVINGLEAGGSTAGSAGIAQAYSIAQDYFLKAGNNRVILLTDGDFNVGPSSEEELVAIIEDYRDKGIFLTIGGFGMGNYKDDKMEQLADHGNGNYYYIDSLTEARKVFVQGLRGTLFTIAKDVKIQVEFNPDFVKAYRLLGYENRVLANEDFNDDTKDAGELGSGHTVTAFYEIIPAGSNEPIPGVDPDNSSAMAKKTDAGEYPPVEGYVALRLRYKNPDEDSSILMLKDIPKNIAETASENFSFASAVVEFGLILRQSSYQGESSFETVITRAQASKGEDKYGYRAEFVKLVQKASDIPQEEF
jgi:Ca-activated chloride channel family protein